MKLGGNNNIVSVLGVGVAADEGGTTNGCRWS